MINKLISEKHLPESTPYFLFDKETLKKSLSCHKKTAEHASVKLIYSMKSLSHIEILKEIAKYVTGFSVSSVFEARLANSVLKKYGALSVTSGDTSNPASLQRKLTKTAFKKRFRFVKNKKQIYSV